MITLFGHWLSSQTPVPWPMAPGARTAERQRKFVYAIRTRSGTLIRCDQAEHRVGGLSGRRQAGVSGAGHSIPVNSTAMAVSGLRKAYGDTTILDGIDLTIGAGPYPMLRTEWLDRLARVMRYLRGDHAFAQLFRFALVGGSSNIAYVLLFMAMNDFGPLVANIVGSIVSTIIANELHRQLTFRAAGRVGWFTAQWEGGGLALIGLLISTAALAGLEFWASGLGEIAQAGAVIAIMAAVGGMRFLALRGFVF